jgi:hypothetical protein
VATTTTFQPGDKVFMTSGRNRNYTAHVVRVNADGTIAIVIPMCSGPRNYWNVNRTVKASEIKHKA